MFVLLNIRQYSARVESFTKTITPVYVNSQLKRPMYMSPTTFGPKVWMCFPRARGVPVGVSAHINCWIIERYPYTRKPSPTARWHTSDAKLDSSRVGARVGTHKRTYYEPIVELEAGFVGPTAPEAKRHADQSKDAGDDGGRIQVGLTGLGKVNRAQDERIHIHRRLASGNSIC